MKSSKLLTLVLSSSLPIPFLYLLGMAYYEGWLESLGVSTSLYPMAMEAMLIKGYFFLYLNFQWLFLLPLFVFLLVILFLFANSLRPAIHQNPSSFLQKFWSIEQWLREHTDGDIKFLMAVAKILFLVLYFGLLLLIFIYVAHENGKDKGLKELANTICMQTDDKGLFSFVGGTTVQLKGHKKPLQVHLLAHSDKFITYYYESKQKRKAIVTVPMSEVTMISFKADVFAEQWGETSKKSKTCQQMVGQN